MEVSLHVRGSSPSLQSRHRYSVARAFSNPLRCFHLLWPQKLVTAVGGIAAGWKETDSWEWRVGGDAHREMSTHALVCGWLCAYRVMCQWHFWWCRICKSTTCHLLFHLHFILRSFAGGPKWTTKYRGSRKSEMQKKQYKSINFTMFK